jgi:arsenite transporter
MHSSVCSIVASRATPKQYRAAHKYIGIVHELSWTDRLLTPFILLSMIIGVIIGEFAGDAVRDAFDTVTFRGVSLRKHHRARTWISTECYTIAIAIGLIVMMWPILAKVQYEALPALFRTWHLWTQTFISLFLNWIVGPFVMLGLAWATLPDLPTYRTGVILVGIARCIAMVMIWNQLARGDANYCAVLVIINSILQIVLYSPISVLFINVIGKFNEHSAIHISYGNVAISVLIVSDDYTMS